MNIEKIRSFNLKDIILISSLPDMGKVGGLVTQHLTKVMNTTKATKIVLQDKPWINQKDGIIERPQDEYLISVNEKRAIVIFSGENQPQESSTVIELSNKVLSTVKEIGKIKLVISTGGYLPNEQGDGKNVFGVATDKKSLDLLRSHGIKPLSKQVNSITWFNGLILGQAKNNQIEGLGLFGEINDTETPQYKAASNIIKKIGKILDIEIDTTELDSKVIEIPVKEKKQNPGIG